MKRMELGTGSVHKILAVLLKVGHRFGSVSFLAAGVKRQPLMNTLLLTAKRRGHSQGDGRTWLALDSGE